MTRCFKEAYSLFDDEQCQYVHRTTALNFEFWRYLTCYVAVLHKSRGLKSRPISGTETVASQVQGSAETWKLLNRTSLPNPNQTRTRSQDYQRGRVVRQDNLDIFHNLCKCFLTVENFIYQMFYQDVVSHHENYNFSAGRETLTTDETK